MGSERADPSRRAALTIAAIHSRPRWVSEDKDGTLCFASEQSESDLCESARLAAVVFVAGKYVRQSVDDDQPGIVLLCRT